MSPSGKTLRLLNHFPDFYRSGDNLQQLLTVLSEALEGGEADLIRVMRSHFVDTANSTGSQGFLNHQRGDLDKLFALYLEKLGGTSQLVQVNVQFQTEDILQLEALVSSLSVINEAKPSAPPLIKLAPLTLDFAQIPEAAEYAISILQRYCSSHARLAIDQWRQPVATLVRLIVGQDALSLYLKEHLPQKTLTKLHRYQGAVPVPPDLLQSFTDDINWQLEQRSLLTAFQQRLNQIKLGHICQQSRDLAQQPDLNLAPDSLPHALALTLRRRLPLPLQKQLFKGEISGVELTAAVRPLFQQLFQNAELVVNLSAIAQNPASVSPAPDNLQLSLTAVQTILQAATAVLSQLLTNKGDALPLLPVLPPLVVGLMRQPIGNRLIRLNRLLLEISYPYDVTASQIPSQTQAQSALQTLLNKVILPDPGLYARNAAFFQSIAIDDEAQQLIQLQTLQTLLPHRLNRLLLEAAFPTELQKSYVPYRERLRELIQVLQRGASTRQGIQDIVAANLGIFGRSAAAVSARKTIQIEEFRPQLYQTTSQVQPFSNEASEITELQRVSLNNPNLEEVAVSLRLKLKDGRESAEEEDDDRPKTNLAPLSGLRWVSPETGVFFVYYGSLSVGDDLWLLADGRLLLNGSAIAPPAPPGAPKAVGKLPALTLPVGQSDWYIDALVGEVPSLLGQAQFDFARFDQLQDSARPITADQASRYRIRVTCDLIQLTPGTFSVRVPWDIPGFTDRFEAGVDHPRSQIPAIINRVRAAGVDFAIAYVKTFTERHLLQTWLTIKPAYRSSHPLFDQVAQQLPNAPPHFVEYHAMEEHDFDTTSEKEPYGPDGIQHQMSDRLLFSGVFDYTEFDSGNRFA